MLSRFHLSAPPCRWDPDLPAHRTTRRAWNALHTNGCWHSREYSSYLQFKAYRVQSRHLSVETLYSHLLILYNNTQPPPRVKQGLSRWRLQEAKGAFFFCKSVTMPCKYVYMQPTWTSPVTRRFCWAERSMFFLQILYSTIHVFKHIFLHTYNMSRASVTVEFIDQRVSCL
jgi:hypothetical protein